MELQKSKHFIGIKENFKLERMYIFYIMMLSVCILGTAWVVHGEIWAGEGEVPGAVGHSSGVTVPPRLSPGHGFYSLQPLSLERT